MTREQRRERVLKLCGEVRDLDNKLGSFSDYEGGGHGPTWQAFKDGYLARRALEAIDLHRKAIEAWGKLYNLARHKTAEERKDA